MKLLPSRFASRETDQTKAPILLSVRPPRTGEMTLLGLENLLQSIAVPEPFSLEMASDADGVIFLVRCFNESVVWHQLAAHYPQARIEMVPPHRDPTLVREGEEAWTVDLTVEGEVYLPLRTFRDDDILDPGSDPIIALIGALSNLRSGDRVTSRLLLQSLGPNWSQNYQDKGFERPDLPQNTEGENSPKKPSATSVFAWGGIGGALAAIMRGYLWYIDGEFLKLGMMAASILVIAILGGFIWLRFFRRDQDLHDPLPIREKVSRIAFNARLEVTAFITDSLVERAEALLAGTTRAYQHYDNPAGARLRASKIRPATPAILPSGKGGLFRKSSVLGVREVASMWHPPGAQDETPFVERSGAKMLLPSRRAVREGALVGVTTTQTPEDIHFADDLLQRHQLLVARTRMGKSTLMEHIILHQLRKKAAGLNYDAVVVVDPHADLVEALLEKLPESLIGKVKLIDLADDNRAPGINLLDSYIFTDRDRTTESVVRIARGTWPDFFGPRMQGILEHLVKTLMEANTHPDMDPDNQYTLLDGLQMLTNDGFRNQVLARCNDPFLLRYWAQDFLGMPARLRAEAIAPVQTRLAYYASSKKARSILGQRRSTLDMREVIQQGGVLLVSTSLGTAGRDVAALVGASILNLTDSIIREQGQLPRDQRRGVLVVVDEMQSMPGVDYDSMLSELGKFGATFILATQSLAKLSALSETLQDTLLANVGCLAVFQVAAADARVLVGELGRERLSEEDITSLPVHECYIRSTVGLERLPTYSMKVLPPPPGNVAVAAMVRASAHEYTTSKEEIEASMAPYRKLVEDFRVGLTKVQPHGPGYPEEAMKNVGNSNNGTPGNNGTPRKNRSRRNPKNQQSQVFPAGIDIPPADDDVPPAGLHPDSGAL